VQPCSLAGVAVYIAICDLDGKYQVKSAGFARAAQKLIVYHLADFGHDFLD
jgi:hypothetical protein